MKIKFVDIIPSTLHEGHLYISIKYNTTSHLCPSGCGKLVVLPLSPAGWSLEYDGATLSLRPSVGNWELECKSHYWITNNQIVWAEEWTKSQIAHQKTADIHDRHEQVRHKKEEEINWLLRLAERFTSIFQK